MGWRDREKQNNAHENGRSAYDGHDGDGGVDAERRAADILRRLGANGTDSEVVNNFLRRVDDRAEEIKRDENDNGKKRWW